MEASKNLIIFNFYLACGAGIGIKNYVELKINNTASTVKIK